MDDDEEEVGREGNVCGSGDGKGEDLGREWYERVLLIISSTLLLERQEDQI